MATRIPNLKRTIRNIKRAQDIIAVLVRFGFTDVVQELSIDRMLLKGKRMVGLDKPGEEISRQPHAVRLRAPRRVQTRMYDSDARPQHTARTRQHGK